MASISLALSLAVGARVRTTFAKRAGHLAPWYGFLRCKVSRQKLCVEGNNGVSACGGNSGNQLRDTIDLADEHVNGVGSQWVVLACLVKIGAHLG